MVLIPNHVKSIHDQLMQYPVTTYLDRLSINRYEGTFYKGQTLYSMCTDLLFILKFYFLKIFSLLYIAKLDEQISYLQLFCNILPKDFKFAIILKYPIGIKHITVFNLVLNLKSQLFEFIWVQRSKKCKGYLLRSTM